MIFDPIDFNFKKETKYKNVWRTYPMPDMSLIGTYLIDKNRDDTFGVYEIMKYGNGSEKRIDLYHGYIPTSEYAFELFKNMQLLLPVILRDNKINEIL